MSLSTIKAWQIVHLLCRSTAGKSKCMLLDSWMLSATWFWWSGCSGDAIFSELLARRLRTLTLHQCSITSVWTSHTKFESFALIGSFELFVSKNEFTVNIVQSSVQSVQKIRLKDPNQKNRAELLQIRSAHFKTRKPKCISFQIFVIHCQTDGNNITCNVSYEVLDTK